MCLRIGPLHLVLGSGRWETFQKSTMCGRVRTSEKKPRVCVGKEAGNLSTKLMMRCSCSWYSRGEATRSKFFCAAAKAEAAAEVGIREGGSLSELATRNEEGRTTYVCRKEKGGKREGCGNGNASWDYRGYYVPHNSCAVQPECSTGNLSHSDPFYLDWTSIIQTR